MGKAVLAGGCHCGAVRYEVDGTPYNETICHCASCRRVSGAPAVAWITVDRAGFRVMRGALRPYASSPGVERGFCGGCGTPMTYAAARTPGEVDVAAATLDEPERVRPRDHVQVGSGLSWAAPRDGLPVFREGRDEGGGEGQGEG